MDEENMKLFGEEFKNGIDRLINQELNEEKAKLSEYEEILLHAKHCKNLTNDMLYNQELCSTVEKYILDDTNTEPFIITGN